MRAVVIGGGIVGLCSAWFLRKEGWDVTLLESGDLSDNCSFGNMGMITPSHFVPLAAPGMVSQGIKWMFDSSSPFYIVPSLDPKLLTWGWAFAKSATKAHVERSAPHLRDINVYSKRLYEAMAAEPGFDFAMEKKGILMYFRTPKVADEEVHLAEKARQLGLDAVALDRASAQALEPGLDMDVLGAVHYRSDAHLYPNKLVPQLVAALKAVGVSVLVNTPVTGIGRSGKKITEVMTPKGTFQADTFVLAGGARLGDLASLAGIRIPMMPGKGYSFTLDHPEVSLNVPAILCEARVAITPMDGRMRYGGTMEIGPINDRVRINRVEAIVASVKKYFPGLKVTMPERKDIWFGFRPCSPDGLPYIGMAGGTDNLLVAGGHAMMGLSLGPATGRIIADLAGGRRPEIPVEAFRADRFS